MLGFRTCGLVLLSFAVLGNGFPTPDEPGTVILPESALDNADERGDYFQGDIKLPPQTRAGLIASYYRWPNRQLTYQIDSGFTTAEQSFIAGAMADISNKTACITFKVRTTEPDYVQFKLGASGSGCWSYLGKLGGAQTLNLEPACFNNRIGTTAHEIIHALGFDHEHNRDDRDRYVTVDVSAVSSGREGNFAKVSPTSYSSMGVPYDYGSIMHYSAYAFAKSGSPTIIPKISTVSIGQRVALSRFDALKLKMMYGCPV